MKAASIYPDHFITLLIFDMDNINAAANCHTSSNLFYSVSTVLHKKLNGTLQSHMI